MTRAVRPSFVLSSERSGSTLLRFLLDSHPAIWAPDEIFTSRVVIGLFNLLEACHEAPTDLEQPPDHPYARKVVSADVRAETRAILDRLLGDAARARGKWVWCDKTPGNARSLPALSQVFGDAHYLCLYRHPLDVVHSCLESYREGFTPADLAQKVAANPQNLIAALSLAWLEKVEPVLRFEEGPAKTHRVRYEDLVRRPAETLAGIFSFFEVEADATVLERAFRTPHYLRAGRGDPKAPASSRVRDDRLGLGAELRWFEAIGPELLRRLNAALSRLGYAALDPARRGYLV